MSDTDTIDTEHNEADGNTTKIIRARYWALTLYNYEKYLKKFEKWVITSCEVYSFQEEICPTTKNKHIQAHIEFKNARTLTSIKNTLDKLGFIGSHIEKVRNKEASRNYCKDPSKDRPENGIVATNLRRPTLDPMNGKVFYDWQRDICDLMTKEADTRKIIWYYDEIGGAGKTSLAKHLCLLYPNKVLYISGKANDVKYGIKMFLDNEKNDLILAIFDFTRSTENFISYEAIESVKNGIYFNNKYESSMVIFNQPHIVCFANFKPEKTKLSEDRWDIINIQQDNADDIHLSDIDDMN